jgi:hypothetical protein
MMLGRESVYEDYDFSFTNGAFLAVLAIDSPEAIRAYLEQARDKWELFLARHQYDRPLYVAPHYTPESKPETQEGWLSKLFKRS